MQLLAMTQPAELPTDALLARLRSRRSAIDLAAKRDLEAAPGEIVDWVYRRLNKQLRKRLRELEKVNKTWGLNDLELMK